VEAVASGNIDFSMIVPGFNEAENIRPFYSAAIEAFADFPGSYEIVFVDDGSSDGTLEAMRAVSQLPDLPCDIRIVSFSRNFGKESAMYAGLEHARGRFQGFIDSDLQQQPSTMRKMLELLMENRSYDCVAAYQENRKDSAFRNWFSRKFYGILQRSSRMSVVPDASDFRVFRRVVGDALLSMPEYNRFSKGLFAWVGFKTLPYPYTPDERLAGDSSWSFSKLVRYAIGGLLSFTTAPLKFSMLLGSIVSIAAVVYLLVIVFQVLLFGVDVPGFATIVALILLFGGLQLFFLGVIGEYLGRAYIQGKNRPIYIAREDTLATRKRKRAI
jgi:glycosyltransferase involved in cell wall biosynthesis